jgi:hypothetical protein
MKRFFIALAALSLVSCGTASLTPSLSPSAQIAAAKAEYAAEVAYNVAGNGYLAAESYLTPVQRSVVKGYLAQAYQALRAARAAETLGDPASLATKIAAVQTLSASITAITSPAIPAAAH